MLKTPCVLIRVKLAPAVPCVEQAAYGATSPGDPSHVGANDPWTNNPRRPAVKGELLTTYSRQAGHLEFGQKATHQEVRSRRWELDNPVQFSQEERPQRPRWVRRCYVQHLEHKR